VRWSGKKPATGLQEAARAARYRLLADAARKSGASAVLTAHTLDDQAETVLIRLARGSGLAGLGGMGRSRPLSEARDGLTLVRPLLGIPKSRLVATLRAENIPSAEDPSNRDPRFTRARLRRLMPLLAEEGLDSRRLALLAGRLARAEATLRQTAYAAYDMLGKPGDRRVTFEAAEALNSVPDEIALRLLGRAVAEFGDEGPVELGKLETLHSALKDAFRDRARFRRSLAGAIVTLNGPSLTIERAPPRRSRTLTTGQAAPRRPRKKQ
jgi:tRNA(Ile)-lysidine synthase